MSVTMQRPEQLWQTRPGWGIVVDLTPGEVVQARQVRVHQRLIGLALVLVLLLCTGLTLLVRAEQTTAERDYDQEQARTAQLAADAEKYAGITTMETVTTQVQGNLTAVMGQDVDIVNLLARVRNSLPVGVAVTNEAVLLTPPVAPVAPVDAAGTDAAPVAPVVGSQIIGTVTISGTGPRIDDVTPFVSQLGRLRGVVDVVPTSVTQSETGTDYTISLNITDELYTKRFEQAGAE